MKTEPQKEHEWLNQLVGDWTYESESVMGPEKPPERFTGTETVRAMGGLWVLCEGRGEMPGGTMSSLMTLGYDPQKKRFVGTWIGSPMSYLWVYSGSLDPTEKVLTLESDGPSFTAEGKFTKYHDVIELKGDGQRLLISRMFGDDGQWHEIMRSTYLRKP